jgi:hypothetical protein
MERVAMIDEKELLARLEVEKIKAKDGKEYFLASTVCNIINNIKQVKER